MFFFADQNRLTGSIPSSIGNMVNLSSCMFVSNNFLTGTIPSTFSNLKDVAHVWMHNNSLTGTIPPGIVNLTSVQVFLAHSNKLRGSMNEIFAGYVAKKMSIFDVSKNRIRGSIPTEAFLNSNISVFASSLNCMDGTIPSSICQASSLQKLVLDGLSLGCSQQSKMTGRIPECLYVMPNLQALYLSSNGLEGRIPDGIITSSPSLTNISVSFNKLSGTIPGQMMRSMFSVLDLSHNHFTGVLDDVITSNRSSLVGLSLSTKLRMSVNRISGAVPESTLAAYSSVDILAGNMFSCGITFPGHDPSASTTVCGSKELDHSLYFLIAVAFLFFAYYVFLRVLLMPAMELVVDKMRVARNIRSFLRLLNEWHAALRQIPPEFVDTRQFLLCSATTRRMSFLMVGFSVFCSLILFPSMKSNDDYSTHTYQ